MNEAVKHKLPEKARDDIRDEVDAILEARAKKFAELASELAKEGKDISEATPQQIQAVEEEVKTDARRRARWLCRRFFIIHQMPMALTKTFFRKELEKSLGA